MVYPAMLMIIKFIDAHGPKSHRFKHADVIWILFLFLFPRLRLRILCVQFAVKFGVIGGDCLGQIAFVLRLVTAKRIFQLLYGVLADGNSLSEAEPAKMNYQRFQTARRA